MLFCEYVGVVNCILFILQKVSPKQPFKYAKGAIYQRISYITTRKRLYSICSHNSSHQYNDR